MKTCFKCGELKKINEFYKHPKMNDGTLNKCKSCAKNDVRDRYNTLVEVDEEFVVSERLRGRDKYNRLYKGEKADKLAKAKSGKAWTERYPEKKRASSACKSIEVAEGFERHHWSYNEEHFRDVIIIPKSLHYKLHRFISYDAKEKKYRTTENTLLATREMHEQYINIVKELF